MEKLEGLEDLEHISGTLVISHNSSLDMCSSICNYLSNPTGVVYIFENSGDCETENITYRACGLEINCPFTLRVSKQHEIDEFPALYPDCHCLPGNLFVDDSSQSLITNLDSLIQFRKIGGFTTISNCNSLSDLHGLDSVTAIGQWLYIYNDSNLTNIENLQKLNTIGAELVISSNPSIKFLRGLNNLDSVGSYLTIYRNDSLRTLEGIDTIQYVGGNLGVRSNFNLKNIQNLKSLSKINGHLSIDYNTKLKSLQGLHNIVNTTGNLTISGNSLTNLNGLNSLKQIGGNFRLTYSNISHLNGLDKLRTIDGDLIVIGNDSLVDLTGIDSLHTVSSSLVIRNNNKLKRIDGLGVTSDIKFNVEITSNPLLDSIQGLQFIRSIGGDIKVINNQNLRFISGFLNLTTLDGTLGFWNNAHLVQISGFDKLRSFRSLIVAGNDSLESLPILPEVYDFFGIEITSNQSLSYCANETFCRLLEDSLKRNKIFFFNNAAGCNSNIEVSSSCPDCLDCFNPITNYWVGNGDQTSWSDPLNWSSGVPEECHNVIIGSGNSILVDKDGICFQIEVGTGSMLETASNSTLIIRCPDR